MLKSVIWSSMLDYPGHVCSSLFFEGCNFNCEYCQNKDIGKAKSIDFEREVLSKLLERKPLVKYTVLSGGECTISPQIQHIVDILYQNGFKIGIHTNGYKPEFLKENKNFVLEPFNHPVCGQTDGMITLLPHLHNTDGFFIAKLRRKS